uniref:Peptidase M10 metallopeptidase domain-containing protein n=1 Tax=Leersia perrieri TaxID=77586 RepID=A0A0D9XMC5_9ORYZ
MAEHWSVDLSAEEDKSAVVFDLESLAVHEIGHILGLDLSTTPGKTYSMNGPFYGARVAGAVILLHSARITGVVGINPIPPKEKL